MIYGDLSNYSDDGAARVLPRLMDTSDVGALA
jgi:hypothetical protein